MRKHPTGEGENLMKNRQHILLASAAALSLFAASGIACAQQAQQDQKGSAAQTSTMHSQSRDQGAKSQTANQGAKNAQQGKNQNAMSRQSSGQNAQNESKMQPRQGNTGTMNNAGKGASTTNQTAQGQQNQFHAQSRTTQSKNGQFANQERNRTHRGASTAQRSDQLKGLQGSTRAPMQGANSNEQGGDGANVSLNDQQRTQIRDSVINSRSAPRVNNPNFSVNVGTVVPRGHIHLVRLPGSLVRIEPRWRHFLYFVYNNEIVIVNPRTMRIVNVMPV
jgi:hypothetical protein